MKRLVGGLVLALMIIALWGMLAGSQIQQAERVRVDEKSVTTRKNSLGWFEVLGEVVNETEFVIGFVKVTITLKDAGGRVMDTEYTYVKGKNVSVGSSLDDSGIFPKERGVFSQSFSQVAGAKIDSIKAISYLVNYRLAGPRADVPDSSSIKKFAQVDSRLATLDGNIGRLTVKVDSLSRDISLHTSSIRALGLSINALGAQLDSLKTRSGVSSKLLGDLNNDSVVDFDDFFIFASQFGKKQ